MSEHASAIDVNATFGAGYTPPIGEDRTCMSWWYPKIQGLVPTPRTEIVKAGIELWRLIDDETPDGYYGFLTRLGEMAVKVAPGHIEQPVFLRTGHTSGKHNWKCCCYLDYDLDGHVRALVNFSAMAGFFGLPYDVWAVREYLPVEPLFRCTAYGDMPVVPERRYFVDGGKLLYSIPYWPEQALQEGEPDEPNWRDKLPIVQREFTEAAAKMARTCGEACGGKWSVDVLLTRDGYYVTDMAEAEKSWGWVEQ